MTATETRQLMGQAITGQAIKVLVQAVGSKGVVGVIKEVIANQVVGVATSKINKVARAELITVAVTNKESSGRQMMGAIIDKALMKITAETPGRISLISISGSLPVPAMIVNECGEQDEY